jgi:hypothetical protein
LIVVAANGLEARNLKRVMGDIAVELKNHKAEEVDKSGSFCYLGKYRSGQTLRDVSQQLKASQRRIADSQADHQFGKI